jgi:hypothetical protein
MINPKLDHNVITQIASSVEMLLWSADVDKDTIESAENRILHEAESSYHDSECTRIMRKERKKPYTHLDIQAHAEIVFGEIKYDIDKGFI